MSTTSASVSAFGSSSMSPPVRSALRVPGRRPRHQVSRRPRLACNAAAFRRHGDLADDGGDNREVTMPVTRGFVGRRRDKQNRLPPGQYDVGGSWPVLTAEATPRIDTEKWSLRV